MLQCKQVWHWMQLCVRLPNNWNESGHQSLVQDLSPRSKLSQCHSFHGESPHQHTGHRTLALPPWAHGYGWGQSCNGSFYIYYWLHATVYYIPSTHDNWQKTEKIVMWQNKIYSNLEVYVDTGVSDGILVMLQLQNWIQKHSYLHLNKLSWFCQVMFLVFYFSVWTFHQVLNLVAEWKYLYQGLGMALIGVNQVSTLKIEILY